MYTHTLGRPFTYKFPKTLVLVVRNLKNDIKRLNS